MLSFNMRRSFPRNNVRTDVRTSARTNVITSTTSSITLCLFLLSLSSLNLSSPNGAPFGLFFDLSFNSAHAQQTLTPPTAGLNNQEGRTPNLDPDNSLSDAEKFQRALAHWEARAIDGDAEAQYKVGALYTNNQYSEPNLEQAIHWYTLASEQGYSLAQYNLGHHYLNGIGVEKNTEIAIQLWLKAARQDHSLSQFNVGRAYYLGIGLPADLVEARVWFEKAAGNNEAKSIALLKKIDWNTIMLTKADTTANTKTDITSTNTAGIKQETRELATKSSQKLSITLYTNPKINAYPISTVDDSSELEIIEESGEWTSIRYSQGFPVWVHSNFVKVTDSQALVTANNVNTRTMPSIINSNVVGRLNNGEELKVLSNSKRWYQVNAPSHFKAWVKTSKLSSHSNLTDDLTDGLTDDAKAYNQSNVQANTKKNTQIKSTVNDTLNNDQWLFEQTPEHYTIELTNFEDVNEINLLLTQTKFEGDNNDSNGSKAHRFDSKKIESTWTYFLYGSYIQKSDAEQANIRFVNQNAQVKQFAKIQQNRCVTWKKQLPPPAELNKYCVPS